MPVYRRIAITVISLALWPMIIAAEEPADEPLWELAVGGYGLYSPEYPGSSETSGNLLVLPFPIYRGKFLRLGEDTEKPIRGQLMQWERVRLDLDADFNFGGKSADIPVRDGMPDLDPMIEAGPELEIRLSNKSEQTGNIFLALQARGAVTFDGFNPSWRGMTFSPEVRFVRYFNRPGQRLKIRVTPTFASSAYAEYFYSVDVPYVTASRPAYRGEGGYVGTTLGISLHQPVTKKFEVRVGARFGMLKGARNESSPLFQDSTNQSAFVAFVYKFWSSERRSEDQ